MQNRRPCDGDHTQHPSGTAERDTLRQFVFSELSYHAGKEGEGNVR